MSTNDISEWILLDTDLATRLAILPVTNSHLYIEFQEPGSGELKIPLDSNAVALVAEGQFCQLYYRGSPRGGFFVDNIKETDADQSEGEGRYLSVSGRGALAILEQAEVWQDGSGATERQFTGKTKAYILKTLIDEAVTRGALANLTYDFTSTNDSAAVAWSDSEDLNLTVGLSLLEVLRQFADTGELEFSIALSGGSFVLSAYKNGIGSDKTSTVYFRIGMNCKEVGSDERGGTELKNVYLVKYKDGYSVVSDPASISARGRREGFIDLELAQSSDSANTFAAAQLSDRKDPKKSTSVQVYDGIGPRLFVDYELGDTGTLDKFGEEMDYRIRGIQCDFDGVDFSSVILEDHIMYDDNLRMRNELDRLSKRWSTAHDADLTEVKAWLGFGTPNGPVNALLVDGDYLYIGGAFTAINGKLFTNNIARYNLSTGVWSAMDTGLVDPVVAIATWSGGIYAATATKVFYWGGTSWTLIGSATVGTPAITSMVAAADDSVLYVGGNFPGNWGSLPSIGGYSVVAWGGASWSAIYVHLSEGNVSGCQTLVIYNGDLYGGFSKLIYTENVCLQKYDQGTGTWSRPLTAPAGGGTIILQLIAVGDTLYWMTYEGKIFSWDGSASSGTLLTDEGTQSWKGAASYLSDVYFGMTLASPAANGVAKYSGGVWSRLGLGLTGGLVRALATNGSELYAGGAFTTADGKSIPYLAVWVTTFQDLVDHLKNDSGFDLGAAIHGATVGTLTDNDEFPFWEDVANALRKITWGNIKSTLQTFFDTIYGRLTSPNTWTRQQSIINATSGDGGVYAETVGDAYTADFEQTTVNTNIASSPANFVARVSSGAGNITTPALKIYDLATGAGQITGPYIQLQDGATIKLQVIKGPAIDALEMGTDPATPSTGHWRIYFKSGGAYIIDDAGNITGPLGIGGGGSKHIIQEMGVSLPARTYLNFFGYAVNVSDDAGNDATNVELLDHQIFAHTDTDTFSSSPQEDVALSATCNYYTVTCNTVDVELGGIDASNLVPALFILKVSQSSTTNLILKHQSVGSAYYFNLPNAQNLTLMPGDEALLLNDGFKWEVVALTTTSTIQGIPVDPALASGTAGQVMAYDGSKLTLADPSGGGGVARVLYMGNNLQDILLTSYPYSLETDKPTGGPFTSTINSITNALFDGKQLMSDGMSSGFNIITKGTFRVFATMKQNSGTREVTAYAEIYKVTAAGVATLLTTTGTTGVITGSYVLYEMTVNDGPFTLNKTDRIRVKIILSGGATGTDASVSIQVGNTTLERLELPATNNVEDEWSQTGWKSQANVWTRTGNYTFTIRADVRSWFREGTRVRWKDGGSYKYGTVLSSSFSSPTTTVTLFTNTDFTMSAATITDTYVSDEVHPDGFPSSFTYTPSTVNVTIGNGTITGEFFVIGNQVFGDYTLTRGSTTSFTGNVNIGVPSTVSQNQYYVAGNVSLVDVATALYTGIHLADGTVRCMNAAGTYAVYAYVTNTVPFAWGTGDFIEGAFRYRF